MFITLAGILAIVGTFAGAYYFAMRPVTLRIAVGPANSDDIKVVQALTQAFTQTHGHIRLRPMQTDGAAASAQALADGKVDLAIIRGDLDVPATPRPWRRCARTSRCCGCPRRQSQGQKDRPEDHQNSAACRTPHRRRRPHPGQCQSAEGDPAAIWRRSGQGRDRAVSGQRGRGGHPQPEGGRLSRRRTGQQQDHHRGDRGVDTDGGAPTFLAIDSAEAIAQNHPVYEASDIPAGAFGGSPDRPDDEVKTISFSHHIVARKELSDSTVAAFTRQLFAIRQSVMAEFPLAAKIETPDTDKDAAIPVHPGAAAFVDGEEKTFLDRYSDYIWWGLMALSAMGSAGAWFAGFLKKDERTSNTSLRDRLLDMLPAARRSDSIEELDRMQSEADNILRDTLHCFDHGTIEVTALTAFNIALDQFHNAVADRKALLVSLPQTTLQRAGAQFRATGT